MFGPPSGLFLREIGQPQNPANRSAADRERRAISDLPTPARCSFRISAAWSPAVMGRPSRLPFCRAWASQPAFVPAGSLFRTRRI